MNISTMNFRRCALALVAGVLVASQSVRADDLKRRGLVGVQLAPLTPEVREHFKITTEKGVVFTGIVPNSAAERGGLKAGDVAIRLNDATIENLPGFTRLLRKYGAGDTIKFTVLRGGQEVTADVTLAPRPLETSEDYDVVYDSAGEPGQRVRTVITKPKDAGKHPAVLLIQDMDPSPVEFSQRPTPFKSLVTELTKAGFVTMRADRLGVGDSEGLDSQENTVETDVKTFRAALQKLSKYEYVDPGKVFVFAHSSGAAIAPLAAADLPVKGIVTFAAFARPLPEPWLEGSIRQWKLEQLSEEEIAANVKNEKLFLEEFFAKKKSPQEILAAHPELKDYMAKFIQDDTFIFGVHYKYFQQLGGLNLSEAWSKVRVPVLALWGEADFRASKEDSELIAATVNKASPGKGQFMAVPQTDHGYNQAEDQEESFLAGFGGNRFNPVVIDTLMKWLKVQTA